MEEFYRKKYLSPNYNRGVSAYIETLEKDKTIAELRKELHQVKEMEEKFDELCLQIARVQKQSKRLESQQAQVQGLYLEKIKNNKAKITEFKQNLLDYKEMMEVKTKKVSNLEAESQQLLTELQRIKKQSQENLEQKAQLQDSLSMQQKLMEEIKWKVQMQKQSSSQMKKFNEMKSCQLQSSYEQFKKKHLELKREELECSSKQEEQERLNQQKLELMKQVQVSKVKLEQSKRLLEWQERECSQLQLEHKGLQWQREKENGLWEGAWSDMKGYISKAKEWSLKIKSNQGVLTQSLNNLQTDKMYLEKMTVKEVQLKKTNERLEESVKHWSQILCQEQSTYGRIISQMKVSIKQDEKAIESLSKQANLLETMIN